MANTLVFLNYCSLLPPGPLAGVTWATLAWRTALARPGRGLARPGKGAHRDTTLGELTGGVEALLAIMHLLNTQMLYQLTKKLPQSNFRSTVIFQFDYVFFFWHLLPFN